MAQGHQIELDPAVMEKLNAFATERNAAPAAIANEAIKEGLASMEERLFWEERRAGASVERGLAALRSAGIGNAPDPGDELPEDLQYLAHERRV
jgi:predicted transcriptional regulator